MILATILTVGWGVLAHEHNTGRRNISGAETAAIWLGLTVATLAAMGV